MNSIYNRLRANPPENRVRIHFKLTPLRHLQDGLVFPGKKKTYLTRNDIQTSNYRAQRKAGLAKVTFHGARHTFASVLLDADQPQFFVKEILRHEHISTTNRYSHSWMDSLTKTLGALEVEEM